MKHTFCLKPYLLQDSFGIIAVYVTNWKKILFKKNYHELLYEKCQIVFILLQLNSCSFNLVNSGKNPGFIRFLPGPGLGKMAWVCRGRGSGRSIVRDISGDVHKTKLVLNCHGLFWVYSTCLSQIYYVFNKIQFSLLPSIAN